MWHKGMSRPWTVVAGLVLLLAACGGDESGDGSRVVRTEDVPDLGVSDTADVADVVDAVPSDDVADLDISDTADVADVVDAADVVPSDDVADLDISGTADVADVLDAADVVPSGGVADLDISDTADVADAVDAVDAVEDTGTAPRGFVRIEPGMFTMGSPEGEEGRDRDEIQHTVTLTRAFLLQSTEVTQGEYEAVMGENPSYFDACGPDCPVELVTWHNAIDYANALSIAEGLDACYDEAGVVIGGATVYACEGYRLPTEAEWEYAARAGTTTATYRGNLSDAPLICSSHPNLDPIAWFCGNSDSRTRAVGTRSANAWGLHDMLGNVWEWTSDWYGVYSGDVVDPEGPTSGSNRVLRGGSWSSDAVFVRAASRRLFGPASGGSSYGFRLARTLP